MEQFLQAFTKIIVGLPLTIEITIASVLCSLILAVIFTKIKICGSKFAAKIIDGYVLIFTGTPLLFQLFIIYFGPGQFEIIRNSWIFPIISEPLLNVIIVFSLNSAAYATMIFSGGFLSLKPGMWEAPMSMGLTHKQSYNLLLPYVLRVSLPSYSNEVILLFKSTSLVMAVTLIDVMGAARSYYSYTYNALLAFAVAGIIYLIVSVFITAIFKLVENYWLPLAVNKD